jgi:hypothetical protein
MPEKPYTDSATIEHHEDGSWTTTTVETHYPASKKQQAVALGALGALCFAPFVPLVTVVVLEKVENRLAARKRRKAQTEKNN